MSKRKKRKSNVVTGLTASLKYDSKTNEVTLTVRGRTHKQAHALYLFSSVRKHPAVLSKGGLYYCARPGDDKVVKADLVTTLFVNPEFEGQLRLEEPDQYWLPPEEAR